MPNRNQCEVMGHLGKDPETRTLQNGQTVTSFSIATSNDYKDKSSGEWQKKDATWWNCQAWGDLGTVIGQSFFKGDAIMVRGKGGLNTFKTRDGEERTSLEIRVSEAYKPIYAKKGGEARQEKHEEYGSSVRDSGDFPPEVLKNVMDNDDADIPF